MKSYVTMEQHTCPVCGEVFDTGSLLMDRRLRDTFEHNTVTDYELCKECNTLYDIGYIALIEIDEGRSKGRSLADIHRTGKMAHLQFDVWERVFNTKPPYRETGERYELALVGKGTIEQLNGMQAEQKP